MIRFETINERGKELASIIERGLGDVTDRNAIVFIGALGICVRKIIPLVKDKYSDPAVVCVDTTGKYVIPVLSGHVGGANELARQIAKLIDAEPIITTQSDNTGLWQLDTLARQYGWNQQPLSHAKMNEVIFTFVNKCPTALILEYKDAGTDYLESTCPEHVDVFHDFHEFKEHSKTNDIQYELVILVSPRLHTLKAKNTIQYYPKCLHLGIGCQKDTPVEAAVQLLREIQETGFTKESICSIGTIELKKDEPMLAKLHDLVPDAEIHVYSSEILSKIDVPNPSDKVFEVTGCYGVAESAAKAANPNSTLIIEKHKSSIKVDQRRYYYTYAIAQDHGSRHNGHIEIVGAGPGDPELISVRGRKFLEKADLILYAGSLVPRELTLCAKEGAVVRSSADMDLNEQFKLMKKFYDEGKLVVRLHTGDPCIYGAIQEQMGFFDKYNMDYHITPGISSFLAAAAELRSEFTIPEECQTIILTRGEGRTPTPEKEKIRLLASHQSTMCIFLSASLARQIQDELLAGGYPPDTPVAACYKLTWKDQRIFRGQLKDLASIINDNNLTLTTMIVVGKAIDNRQGYSKLYDSHFTHLFRKGKE